MNSKLRSILSTAWNEPRHFFFWLGTLVLSALLIMALAVANGLPLNGPLWSLVGLGLTCCLLGSVVAFILAWIPPVRRFFSGLLRHRFLALAAFCTLIALFYAMENWRGSRAWRNYKADAEAKGERLELSSIIPPQVPADQNFFETSLWNDMHFTQATNTSSSEPTGGTIIWSDTNWGNRAVFDLYGPSRRSEPQLGRWRRGERINLSAWQVYYRGSNNVFTAADGAFTNYFPLSPRPQSPAADVLLALSRFEAERTLLAASASRPYSRFWINYDAGFAALLPHLSRVKRAGQFLSLHSEAARQMGDKQSALEDIKLSVRLMEAVRNEPIIISQLVRIAMLDACLQPIWEGLADHQWTEPELRVLDTELRNFNFLDDYHRAFRGERGFNLWLMDYLKRGRGQDVFQAFAMMTESPHSQGWQMDFLGTVIMVVPRGWFDQNKVTLCRMFDTYLMPVADRTNGIIRPSYAERARRASENKPIRPYDAFSSFLLPSVSKAASRFADGQAMADLARVACALERYRLAKGEFPESLTALSPIFLDRLPHDVITGEPLKYRRMEHDRYVLYSVGWNGVDDGGVYGAAADKRDWSQEKGDWVWELP